jgi:hypothetical protein
MQAEKVKSKREGIVPPFYFLPFTFYALFALHRIYAFRAQ